MIRQSPRFNTRFLHGIAGRPNTVSLCECFNLDMKIEKQTRGRMKRPIIVVSPDLSFSSDALLRGDHLKFLCFPNMPLPLFFLSPLLDFNIPKCFDYSASMSSNDRAEPVL